MKRTIAILVLLALPHMIVAAEPVPRAMWRRHRG